MKSQVNIETRGFIVKEEMIQSLQDKILKNTMVLESSNPYYGYYGRNMPDADAPRSVFIVLDKKYDSLFLSRALLNISNKRPHKCYAAFGCLLMDKEKYFCVRIKNLDCFDSIPEIQTMMRAEGINFHKAMSMKRNALICIEKSFLLNEIEDNVYKDMFEPNRYYINIQYTLDFEEFRRITHKVKNNIDNSMFDAALATIWRIDGLDELVRIYDKNNDMNRLRQIRQMYLTEIFKSKTNVKNSQPENHWIL